MGYETRCELYKKLEEIRGCPLLAYATSIRPGENAAMAPDVIREFINQINKIPRETKSIDLLLVSNGGDPITSWRIVNILRSRFKKICVLVPYVAYSAATLLALGADEIIMHPYSNLGPVDPQIIVTRPNKGQMHFGSEDIRNYIEFVKNDFGIKDQEYLVNALNTLCNEVGTLPIGSAKRSNQLSISLGEKMLAMHMTDCAKAHAIATALNSSYYHHGYAVGRKEAKDIGLNVVNSSDEIEDIIWNIWEDISDEMKCDKPFDLTTEIMENPAFSYLNEVKTIEGIPANISAQVQGMLPQLIRSAISIQDRAPVDLCNLLAVLESIRRRSTCNNHLKVIATRMPDMNININVSNINKGWESVDNIHE